MSERCSGGQHWRPCHEGAREARIPVIWVQDSDQPRTMGSDAWKIVPELTPIATP